MVRPSRVQGLLQGMTVIAVTAVTSIILFTAIYSILVKNVPSQFPIPSLHHSHPFMFIKHQIMPAQHMSDFQRIRHVLRRLSYYDGAGRGPARLVHVIVSVIGIYGMFAAVIGALLAPWLVQAGNSILDDDQFVYWVRADDEDDEDENGDAFQRACGPFRERKFAFVRLLDVA